MDNVEPAQQPEIYASAPAYEGRAEKIARTLTELGPLRAATTKGAFSVELPPRIPAQCVNTSARDYGLNPFVLLALLKVESGGRVGIVSKNTNGTLDLGPAQFNTNSWAKKFEVVYHIPREALVNDMCQAIRAMAFAVATEIKEADGDMWRGIGNYHSHTPVYHNQYVAKVANAHREMLLKGKF